MFMTMDGPDSSLLRGMVATIMWIFSCSLVCLSCCTSHVVQVFCQPSCPAVKKKPLQRNPSPRFSDTQDIQSG